MSRLGKLLSSKDSVFKELRASNKLITQELEAARLNIKALEDDCAVMKMMCGRSRLADPNEEAWCCGA